MADARSESVRRGNPPPRAESPRCTGVKCSSAAYQIMATRLAGALQIDHMAENWPASHIQVVSVLSRHSVKTCIGSFAGRRMVVTGAGDCFSPRRCASSGFQTVQSAVLELTI